MVLACSSQRRSRAAYSAIAMALTVAFSTPALSEEYETRWIEPRSNVDVYWSINLGGRVYVAADIDGQPACLDYWWIVWPFTQIKSLGRFCGRATFDIPRLSDLAIGASSARVGLEQGRACEAQRMNPSPTSFQRSAFEKAVEMERCRTPTIARALAATRPAQGAVGDQGAEAGDGAGNDRAGCDPAGDDDRRRGGR